MKSIIYSINGYDVIHTITPNGKNYYHVIGMLNHCLLETQSLDEAVTFILNKKSV